MSDRLSQLQCLITDQANMMTNAIGVLVLQAPACDFNSSSEELDKEEQSQLLAKLIAETAAKIDSLIESLPAEEILNENINEQLLLTDSKRSNAARELEQVYKEGEDLATRLQGRLTEISRVQLESRPRV